MQTKAKIIQHKIFKGILNKHNIVLTPSELRYALLHPIEVMFPEFQDDDSPKGEFVTGVRYG